MANIFTKQNGNYQRVLPPISNAQSNFTNNFGIDNFTNNYGRVFPPVNDYPQGMKYNPNSSTPALPRTLPANPPVTPPNTPPQTPNAPTQQGNQRYSSIDAFNLLLQKALKDAQSIDNTDNLKLQKELQLERIKQMRGEDVRTSEPGLLGGMSPDQYNQIRNANTNATDTSITEVQYQIEKNNQARQNLLEQIQFAREAGNDVLERDLKAKAFDLDERRFEEEKRSNLVNEYNAAHDKIPAGDISGDITKKSQQFDFLQTVADNALKYAYASGRSGIRKTAGDIFSGSTGFTELMAQASTLRTNLLTLLADPDVKKFFGPQMSNADVGFMMAGGTPLNPELQSPESLKTEINHIKDTLTRAKQALYTGMSGGQAGGEVVTAPDGQQYQFID